MRIRQRLAAVFSAIIFILGSAAISKAQQSTFYTHGYTRYLHGLELFNKEKYGAAQQEFNAAISQVNDPQSEVSANAQYYAALCGLELFNSNAEDLLIKFIQTYPESPKVNNSYFQLGRYQYRKKRFKRALEWFEEVDIYMLSNTDIAEYYFKMGYSAFKEEDYDKAKKALYEIKDSPTKYQSVAQYYYGHITYHQKEYENALTAFKSIEAHEKFKSIVPYYIAQIYYFQKKYDLLREYVPPILDSANVKRLPEISRLLGEAYYHTGDYENAIPYLEKYMDSGKGVKPIDRYQMGFAHFQLEQYDQAIEWFKSSMDADDSLNQVIQYNLAECFIKTDEKNFARNSFRAASLMDFDKVIAEDALFNYAKLSYELSREPYNNAIRAFEEYIGKYPNSTRINDAHEYLVGVYFTTKNFEEAKASLERIDSKGYKLQLAYQKVLYFLGVEHFIKGKYGLAIASFDDCLEHTIDRSVRVNAIYWKAEANYRLLKYDLSLDGFNQFINEPGAISSGYFKKANYSLAYNYYRKKEYDKAIFWFRKFADMADSSLVRYKNDAYLRIADGYFVTKEYEDAAEYYDKAIFMGLYEVDYALFQSATSNGVIGNYAEKANLLKTLLTGHKESAYYPKALFELGEIEFRDGQLDDALAHFRELINQHPNSSYMSKALLKSGMVHYQRKEDDLAITDFKQVIQNHKGSSDAREARDKIRRIYVDRGIIEEYEAFIAEMGGGDISTFEVDSTTYYIAENTYLEGQCEKAASDFTHYIEKYENGHFILDAHYYRGDCEMRSEFYEEALIDFKYVIGRPKNQYTVNALKSAAKISRKMERNEEAIGHYKNLEKMADAYESIDNAHYWIMKLSFETEGYEDVIQYSELIQAKDHIDPEIIEESQMLAARSYLKSDNYNKAYDTYMQLAGNASTNGAEARYEMARIQYLRGNYDESEAMIDSVLSMTPSYKNWVAKSFIIWSDVYLAKEDVFQAKYALQMVIDNHKGADLVQLAEEKLNAIVAMEEQAKSEVESPEEVEIKLDDTDDYDHLFEEEIIEEELNLGNENNEESN